MRVLMVLLMAVESHADQVHGSRTTSIRIDPKTRRYVDSDGRERFFHVCRQND